MRIEQSVNGLRLKVSGVKSEVQGARRLKWFRALASRLPRFPASQLLVSVGWADTSTLDLIPTSKD